MEETQYFARVDTGATKQYEDVFVQMFVWLILINYIALDSRETLLVKVSKCFAIYN